MASYLSLVLIFTFSVQAGHADLNISTSTPTPCYGDVVTLVCHHPELASNGGRYLTTQPTWRENGVGITPSTGIYLQEDTSEDLTHTTLTINITVDHFMDNSFKYSCFLVLAENGLPTGGVETSEEVTVDAVEPTRPNTISIITCHNTSIAFYWTHSPMECYEDRIRYRVSWVNVDNSTDKGSITVEATTYNITDLSFGNTYTISVQSVLGRDIDVIVQSEPLSRKVTTGKPLVHCQNQVACYNRNFTLFCEISSIHKGQYSSLYWTLNSTNLTDSNKYHFSKGSTQLDIYNVAKEAVGDYRCCIVLNSTTHVGGETYPLHPLGSPNRPHITETTPGATNITLSWDHDDSCFKNYTFSFNVTWQKAETSEERKYSTVNERNITIFNLEPNANYSICMLAVSNSDANLKSKERCLHYKTLSNGTTTATIVATTVVLMCVLIALLVVA